MKINIIINLFAMQFFMLKRDISCVLLLMSIMLSIFILIAFFFFTVDM